MKIALLTIWHEKNYGAELQAYATIKVLQNLGHEVEMIDVRLSDMGKPSLAGWVSLMIESVSPCNKKFNNFWKKYIPTTKRYKSIEELKKDPPKADVYMVGSDQVWNPEITRSFSNLYFLDFGEDSVKRVSYASSFGVSEWKFPELKESVTKLLSRFSFISCREQSGVMLLKETFGMNGENVVDPTILLGDYNNFIAQQTSSPNLVCYPLGHDPELLEQSHELAKQLNMNFIDNFNAKIIFGRIVWNRNSIEQWINNIANADFVVTRSFHGMLFSVMHHKQFAVIAGKNGRGVRLQNFLSSIGLMDRYYDNFEQMLATNPWLTPIDYQTVDHHVEALRAASLDKLIKMLTL